jgi:hypothetical protein
VAPNEAADVKRAITAQWRRMKPRTHSSASANMSRGAATSKVSGVPNGSRIFSPAPITRRLDTVETSSGRLSKRRTKYSARTIVGDCGPFGCGHPAAKR